MNISKRSPFLVIAYYTIGDRYETLSENLKRSCQDFNIDIFTKGINTKGSWEKNTHYKANFILECLETFSQDLLYVDVDALFRGYPDLFENIDCDISYRTENFSWRKNEALSGTIYFKNNKKINNFVKKWIELNNSCPANRMIPETWEQKNMQRALDLFSDIKYYNLPPGYTYIVDHSRRLYPNEKIIIEHFQESRHQFKNKGI